MNISELISDESRKLHERYMAFGRRMAQKKKGKHRPITYEIEIVTKHGAKVYLEVSAWLIYKHHKPIAIQGIARDITQRKLEEIRLKNRNNFCSIW